MVDLLCCEHFGLCILKFGWKRKIHIKRTREGERTRIKRHFEKLYWVIDDSHRYFILRFRYELNAIRGENMTEAEWFPVWVAVYVLVIHLMPIIHYIIDLMPLLRVCYWPNNGNKLPSYWWLSQCTSKNVESSQFSHCASFASKAIWSMAHWIVDWFAFVHFENLITVYCLRWKILWTQINWVRSLLCV